MPRSPLLRTKLAAPALRSPLVPRPRLLALLAPGPDHRLTVVAAPAGFGKTTTVRMWLEAQDRPWAWLSLDVRDNDPVRFFRYLTAAIRSVYPALAAAVQGGLHDAQEPDAESLLTGLIHELASRAHALVLVLDDCHTIDAPPVHRALAFLVEHAPAHVHLVLCGRATPPLPLARWRARGQATTLGMRELRFGADETAALWETVGLALPAAATAALVARTEGWIAGLHLAALSLRQGTAVGRVVEGFGGVPGDVADYLVQEVLDAQPAAARALLVRSAILDRLAAPLCSAVAGIDESTARAVLEGAGLFVVPLDEQRRWYRYHHLFGALLAALLGRELHADAVAALHQRAGIWHEREGLIEEAVAHLLAAGDPERAAGVIERCGAAILWERGEMRRLLAWIEALPEPLIAARAGLCLLHAWLLFELYVDRWALLEARVGQAQALLHGARAQLALVGADTARRQARDGAPGEAGGAGMLAEAEMLAAILAARRGDPAGAIAACERAIGRAHRDDRLRRGLATILLAAFAAPDGDIRVANARMAEGMALSRAAGNPFAALIAAGNLIAGLVVQGRLGRAEALYRSLQDLLRAQPGPPAGMVHISAGAALYERDDLQGAEAALRAGLALCRPFAAWWAVVQAGSITLARVLQARGDTEGVWRVLAGTPAPGAASHIPYPPVRMDAWEARLWLLQGNLAAAALWAEAQSRPSEGSFDVAAEEDSLALARIHLARAAAGGARTGAPAHLDAARALLDRLERDAAARGRRGRLAEISLLRARRAAAAGDTRGALDAARLALGLAEPEGAIRLFAEDGGPIAALLRTVAADLTPAYRARLLAVLPAEGGRFGRDGVARRPEPPRGPHRPGVEDPPAARRRQAGRGHRHGAGGRGQHGAHPCQAHLRQTRCP